MKIAILLFSIFSFITSASANEALKQKLIQTKFPNNRTLKVTSHPDYAPVVWIDHKDKKMKGMALDLLRLILDEVEVKVESVNVNSWGRAQEEVRVGRVDMLLPPYKTSDREKVYAFQKAPFLMDDTVIFVKRGRPFFFDKYDHLVGKKGVSIINDSFGQEFDNFSKKKLNMTRLTKTAQCFEFLLKDRADYFVAGLNAGLVIARKMKINDEIDILPTRVVSTGMYFAISKASKWANQDLLEYINTRVTQMHVDGTLDRLQRENYELLSR